VWVLCVGFLLVRCGNLVSFSLAWCYGVANLLGIFGVFLNFSFLVVYDGNGRYPGMELYNRPNSMPS